MSMFTSDQMGVVSGAILKQVYAPKLIELISDKIQLLDLFEKDSESWEGLQVNIPILVGRGQSFMAHGALGLLPVAQNEVTYNIAVPTRWFRGRVQFSVESMKRSMSSKGAFIKSNELLMNRLVKNAADERNRMLASGSGTGILALVNGAGGGTTTLNVDTPANGSTTANGGRYLQPGMLIAIIDPSTQVLYCIRQIVSVAAAETSVVLDSAVSAAEAPDNAWIVRVASNLVTNVTRDTSYNNEPYGFEAFTDDGTILTGTNYLGVNRSVAEWNATRINSSFISLDVLQRMYDTIDQVAGEPITDHLVHHSVRRAYLSVIDATRTFMQTGEKGNFDLGFEPQGTKITFNGDPLVCDRDLPLGKWKMVNRNHLTYYSLTEGEWADETGSVFRPVAGQDALEAIWRWSGNFVTEAPFCHGEIYGLSTTNAIARHVA